MPNWLMMTWLTLKSPFPITTQEYCNRIWRREKITELKFNDFINNIWRKEHNQIYFLLVKKEATT